MYHQLKTVSLCKTPLPYIAPMHTLPQFYPIPAHGCPPPILSQPMHTLPLFYPNLCMPSPYSIPAHAHPSPILSHPMHAILQFCCQPMLTLPLFYSSPSQPMHTLPLLCSTPCMPYLFSMPPYACPLPILSKPTQGTPVFYSIPTHACPPNSWSHTP